MDAAAAQAEQQQIFTPPARMASPLSETEAATYLATTAELPSIRALAAQWGWHRSKVERFLKRPECARVSPLKTETATETLTETVENTTVVPIAERPPPEQVDETPDDADLVIAEQMQTWVYPNKGGNITIRQDGFARRSDDQIVVVPPEHVEALASRLKQVAEEIFRDRRAAQ